MLFEEKSTEELEDLLAISFFEDTELDMAYIEVLLNAIREREGTEPNLGRAWADFKEFVKCRESDC